MTKQQTETLAFYLNDGPIEQFRDLIVSSLNNFFCSRKWAITAPNVIVSEHPDEDGYAIVGTLELYSARYGKLDRDLDEQAYSDVSKLIEFLEGISRDYHITIEFDIDSDMVGSIRDGRKCDSLTIGLLGEWKRQLEA